MVIEPVRFRPRIHPPPEFPPRRVAPFARTPPAIFPVLLGLLGLVVALRAGLARLGLPAGPGDLVAGLVLGLWLFGVLAYLAKLARRPGVILDDLKVMPARTGLAAGSAGFLTAAAVMVPFSAAAATGLLFAGLGLHLIVALLILRVLAGLPPEARRVNPGWHIIFTGFILGAPAAALLGIEPLARGLIWVTLPVAAAIWGVSVAQLLRGLPPAPLRPMLAIHMAPACLFAISAALTGQGGLAAGFGALALAVALVLLAAGRWITASGFSPLWGAFTFPLAALAQAMLRLDGAWAGPGIGVLAVAVVAVPWIAWRVLKLWPGGRLAGRTNAAEA